MLACAALGLAGPDNAIWLLIGDRRPGRLPAGAERPRQPERAVAAAANASFFRHGADTTGLHRLSWFLLVIGVLLLMVTLLDRTLHHIN
ncbi:MAG TPA: hypothetical protein VGD34_08005 [Kribbella sp.]